MTLYAKTKQNEYYRQTLQFTQASKHEKKKKQRELLQRQSSVVSGLVKCIDTLENTN